ncbi:hypothetical protein BGZ67_006174, partial [Mortierella alpina]
MAMEKTQLFRLTGSTDIKEIICDQVEGLYVVFLEDIEDAFEGAGEVKEVKKGNAVVTWMRNSSRI